eukprot:GHRR01012200.1.p1 GENE.GHRR01012200.1~~GHRR01012200.1.p1  ORF type:complete len:354 (+),score=130.94 GHRR01012200.1:86-1147(+)
MNGRANMQTGHQHCTCWPSQVAHCQPRRPVCAAQRRNRDAPVFQQDFEVPQAGWMWDAGKAAATKKSLKAANIKAKKSLGQNFCTDDNILADIVTAARVTPSDVVIEVGPGTGNLTRHLIATQAPVLAIEKDDTLIESLREEFKEVPNLQLVHGDVMRLDLQQLVSSFTAEQPVAADTVRQATCSSSSSSRSRSHGSNTSNTNSSNGNGSSSNTSSQSVVDDSITESSIDSSTNGAAAPSKRLKVVANLPYNITKDFLLALLPQGDVVSELSIMIQQEVADRLIDPTPGRHNYRAMSVLTHYYSKPVYRFRYDACWSVLAALSKLLSLVYTQPLAGSFSHSASMDAIHNCSSP